MSTWDLLQIYATFFLVAFIIYSVIKNKILDPFLQSKVYRGKKTVDGIIFNRPLVVELFSSVVFGIATLVWIQRIYWFATSPGMGFFRKFEMIIFSGTKLNINYAIDDLLDEDQQEEIHDYFMEAESDKIQDALDEFDGDYDDDELRLMRIKFINEVAN